MQYCSVVCQGSRSLLHLPCSFPAQRHPSSTWKYQCWNSGHSHAKRSAPNPTAGARTHTHTRAHTHTHARTHARTLARTHTHTQTHTLTHTQTHAHTHTHTHTHMHTLQAALASMARVLHIGGPSGSNARNVFGFAGGCFVC
jgi:hypothetical protein